MLVGILLLLVLLGIPLAFAIGLSSMFYIMLFYDASQLTMVAQRLVSGVDSFSLLALPLFVLAGQIMAHGDITPRLTRFAKALVGSLSGGMAMVLVLSSMMFGALSGSGVADVAAIGTVLLPAMREARYGMDFSAALLGCAGVLATVIPPSIVMVLLGVVMEASIGKLLLAGIVPGVLTGGALMVYAYFFSIKEGYPRGERFSLRELAMSFKEAFPALFTGIIILGGILGGIFTATEAAAVAVGYALLLAVVVYRKIGVGKLLAILLESAETTAIILLIISSASLFAWVMAAEQIPLTVAKWFLAISQNYYVLLVLINLFLIILGTFMETVAIIFIVVPVLMPLVEAMKMDPVHFGVLICLNLAIGANTPPVAVCLATASRVAGTRFEDACGRVGPMILVMVVVLVLVMLVPALATFVPNLVIR